MVGFSLAVFGALHHINEIYKPLQKNVKNIKQFYTRMIKKKGTINLWLSAQCTLVHNNHKLEASKNSQLELFKSTGRYNLLLEMIPLPSIA